MQPGLLRLPKQHRPPPSPDFRQTNQREREPQVVSLGQQQLHLVLGHHKDPVEQGVHARVRPGVQTAGREHHHQRRLELGVGHRRRVDGREWLQPVLRRDLETGPAGHEVGTHRQASHQAQLVHRVVRQEVQGTVHHRRRQQHRQVHGALRTLQHHQTDRPASQPSA